MPVCSYFGTNSNIAKLTRPVHPESTLIFTFSTPHVFAPKSTKLTLATVYFIISKYCVNSFLGLYNRFSFNTCSKLYIFCKHYSQRLIWDVNGFCKIGLADFTMWIISSYPLLVKILPNIFMICHAFYRGRISL
jgi:hypothetical protein